jgi:hypothetical protein
MVQYPKTFAASLLDYVGSQAQYLTTLLAMSQSNKVESQQHAERLRWAEMALEALRNVIKNNPGTQQPTSVISTVTLTTTAVKTATTTSSTTRKLTFYDCRSKHTHFGLGALRNASPPFVLHRLRCLFSSAEQTENKLSAHWSCPVGSFVTPRFGDGVHRPFQAALLLVTGSRGWEGTAASSGGKTQLEYSYFIIDGICYNTFV